MIGGSKLLLALGSAIASLNVFEVQFEPTRYQQNLKKLGGAELNLNRASRTLFTSGYAMIHLVTLCNIRLHVIYALVAATGRYRSSVVVRDTTRLWQSRHPRGKGAYLKVTGSLFPPSKSNSPSLDTTYHILLRKAYRDTMCT